MSLVKSITHIAGECDSVKDGVTYRNCSRCRDSFAIPIINDRLFRPGDRVGVISSPSTLSTYKTGERDSNPQCTRTV